jgi:hypothetical protein
MSVRAIFTGMLPYLVTPFPHSSSFGSVAKVECDIMAGEHPESDHANVSHNDIFSLKQINVRHSTHVFTTGVRKCVIVRKQLDLVLSDKLDNDTAGEIVDSNTQTKHSCIIYAIQFWECALCNLRRRNYDWEARHNMGVREAPKFLHRVSMKYRCSFPKAT